MSPDLIRPDSMFFDQVRRGGEELALEDGTRSRTWSELGDRVLRLAHFIRDECGVAAEGHVATLLGNRAEAIELTIASIVAGTWITPINWHLAPDEIDYTLGDSGARVLFVDDIHEGTARALAEAHPRCRIVPVGTALDRALEGVSDAPFDADGPAGGNMIYTSGTTGRPKGVKRTRPGSLGATLEHQVASGRNIGLDGSGRHLVTGPLYHAAPLMFAVYDMAAGAPVVVMPRWDERRCLDLLREREIAHTHLVPTMFVRLLRLPESERTAFSAPRLDLVLHGAAPVSVGVKRRMIEWWGPVLVEYWGGTEGGVNTLVGSQEWLEHPGTVGRALPAFEVFAVDSEGRRLPAGEEGDLYCRHRTQPTVFEYHGAPEKTAAAYLEPGVFTLGDVGSVDEDGWVRLTDRRSHMIISGGVNIYPREIEQVLAEHPAVADVAVFGIPDDEWGESVKAAVELLPGKSGSGELEREILAWGRERLAAYKVPRSIDFEAELPRQPSGKIYTRRLREPYWAAREKRI
jgi:long-chain acyl-CoA synthetase